MRKSVTVVTGADVQYRQSFDHFVRLEYGAEYVDFVFRPDAEIALARADRFMPPEMQFVVRDVLETQIQQSLNAYRPVACVLICRIACNRNAEGFEECVHFARRVHAGLTAGRLFHQCRTAHYLACFMPNREIAVIA